MARIKIEDLPESKKIDKKKLRKVHGGVLISAYALKTLWYTQSTPILNAGAERLNHQCMMIGRVM